VCVVGVNDGGGGCYVGAGVHGGEPLHTARGGVVFRGDIKSRCELEPVGVVEILGNTSSETVHVLLRMGVGDAAIPSQGGVITILASQPPPKWWLQKLPPRIPLNFPRKYDFGSGLSYGIITHA